MLHNYALLNNTALIKLIEKFNNITIEHSDVDLFFELNNHEFTTATETIKIRKSLETVYAGAFLSGAKPSKAKKELTARRHDESDVNMYLIGYFIGVASILLFVWILSVIRKYLLPEDILSKISFLFLFIT